MMLFCLISLAMLIFINATDYCSIDCDGVKNTMCAYPAGGGDACGGYHRGLTPREREVVLDEHNKYRQKVAQGQERSGPQPEAADMMELTWDDEVEALAQRWVEQCTVSEPHDTCRKTSDHQFVGQNIASGYGTSPKQWTSMDKESVLRSAVRMWYDEVQYVSPSLVRSFNPGSDFQKLGHYTQLVWAKTSRLGCGISFTVTQEGYKYKLGCNYKPGGNVSPTEIYKAGSSCSDCPRGSVCSSKYPGLCSAYA